MKRFFRIMSCAVVAALLLCGAAFAADGIEPNTEFTVPYRIDGTSVAASAIAIIDADGNTIMAVPYHVPEDGKIGKIKWAYYKVERIDKPDPVDPPDPPNPVNQKYSVCFFMESNELDDGVLTDDQMEMLVGLKFRKDLKAKGHNFVGSFDSNSCESGKCKIVSKTLKPWFDNFASQKVKMPCVAIAPIEGGPIKFYPLPKTMAELDNLIGGEK